MNNAFVVDADSHILEPIDLWENYLEDKSLLPLAPRFFNDENGDQQLSMEGELLSKKGFGLGGRNVNKKWDRSLGKQRWEEQEPGGFDPHIRIKDMDAAGVDAGLVFPTIGLRYSGFKDAVLGAACCRAHNKWMADFARPYPDRLRICPWRKELLEGMLGASIVGFHTQLDCNSFVDSADRFLEARIEHEHSTITYQDDDTLVESYPISIEWPRPSESARCIARKNSGVASGNGFPASGPSSSRVSFSRAMNTEAFESSTMLRPSR